MDIIEELKYEIRNVEREKVRNSIEKELGYKPQPRTHYTLYSRRLAEKTPQYAPEKNTENKVHYKFTRFEAETWKSTNDFF